MTNYVERELEVKPLNNKRLLPVEVNKGPSYLFEEILKGHLL